MSSIKLSARRLQSANDMRAVQADMYERGCTDGLPVVPPTEEAVREMLEYAQIAPDAVLGEMMPRDVPVTAEKAAINAVMAGCLPQYFPVLVAGIKAVCTQKFNLLGIQATTNPVCPILIINGPIRRELDINCGRGCLGPGWRANATIGRALRLVMINCGGAIPGEIDKSTHGMPGKYSFCFGEIEEESPWQPLHVERGFAPEQSTVTAIGGQGTASLLADYLVPENILHLLADGMRCYGYNPYRRAMSSPLIVMTPGHARILANAGWSKQRVKEHLFEHTKIARSAIPDERNLLRVVYQEYPPEQLLTICAKPEDISLVVAGGPEAYHITYIPSFGHGDPVTVPITLPDRSKQ